MVFEPVDDDPIRQFTADEEKKLTLNLFKLIKRVRLIDSKNEVYSIDLFRSWHFQLFDKVREHAGRLRGPDYGEDILNFGPHRSTSRGSVMYELEEHVDLAHNLFLQLDELDSSLEQAKFVSEAIKVALYLHAMFIKIHPFRDGNGRVGRLAMTFTLSKYSVPPLSIEVPRKEYIDCLNYFYVSKNKDIDPLYDLAIRIYNNQI